MRAWSAVPRFGEATPDPRFGRAKGNVRSRVRASRAASLLSGALLLAAVATWGAFWAEEVAGGVSPQAVLSYVVAPAAGLFAMAAIAHALILRRLRGAESTRLLVAAAGMILTASLGLLAAVGAGAFRGRLAAAGVPGLLAPSTGPTVALAVGALVILLIPFLAGAYVHAIALAVDGAGLAPARVPLRRALRARTAGDLLAPAGAIRIIPGSGRALLLGLASPALAIASLALTLAGNLRAAAAGEVRDEVHALITLEELGEGLAEAHFGSRAYARTLVVGVPRPPPTDVRLEGDGTRLTRMIASLARSRSATPLAEEGVDSVRITRRTLLVPALAHGDLLVLTGPPAAVRTLRRAIETDLLFRAVFAWSLEAVRYERRLNRLAREAVFARTIEERGVLLEAASRLENLLNDRAFVEEEWNVLAGWKTARVRAQIQEMLLREPIGLKSADRLLAPAPAIPADLGRLVESAGLANVRRLVFVPYWLVPVQTTLGERDVLVNALTRDVDLAESRDLLAASARAGTTFFVDATRETRFETPLPPSGALFGEVRQAIRQGLGYRGLVHIDENLLDLVYVPFAQVAPDDRFVNAVTGKEDADLAKAIVAEARTLRV